MSPRIRTALACVAAFGAVMALVGAAAFGVRIGASVAVGAAIAVANLWALAKIIGAIASPEAQASARTWGVLAGLKMIGLFLVVWMLWKSGLVDPLALVIGYTALPLGITVGSFVSDRREAPDDPADDGENP